LAVCAPAGAQCIPPAAQESDSKHLTTQIPQSTPDSDKKTALDQTSAPLPDSTKLQVIKSQKADYPFEGREHQLQGEVVVKVLVSETGDVESVEVVSGDPILARAAVDAAKKWKFQPFIKNGKPVKVATKLPFDFAFSDRIHDRKDSGGNPAPTPNSTNTQSLSDSPKPVLIPEGVTKGLLLHSVSPVYPYEARHAGIQGTVVLRAIINKEGMISDLHPVSGPKELVPAAMGAVQQWRYKPYLLKGNPVEVTTEVRVSFTLGR
jgi:TonB family protein